MIKQIRYGFATNSSSSHSVILTKAWVPQMDTWNFEYGWGDFNLVDAQSKRDYYFMATFRRFRGTDDWDAYLALVAPSTGWEAAMDDGYIDHQSNLFSVDSLEKVRQDLALLDRNDVVIFGGNDNTPRTDIPEGFNLEGCTVRYVKGGLVIFSRLCGTKIHILDEDVDMDTFISEFPELVDIKITDYCDLGCKFCYQNSTVKGRPASMAVLTKIMDDLKAAGTFEVALGGGEPASHPNFTRILEEFRSRDIIPNFTTRNYRLMSHPEFSRWSYLCGSIGVSISNAKDLRLASSFTRYRPHNVSLQIAMGTQSKEEFIELLREFAATTKWRRVPLILLGYKTVGRGSRMAPDLWYENDEDLYEMLKEHAGTISIDTEMARKTAAALAKSKVPPELYMKHEGRVSCYIDAVTRQIAPSSYCDPELFRPYDLSVWTEMAEEYRDKTCQNA